MEFETILRVVWEILKFAGPIGATVFVGWKISRGNEKFKIELTRDLNRFQTRDSLLHQKQAEAIEQIYGSVCKGEFVLKRIVTLFRNPGVLEQSPFAFNERLEKSFDELQEINKSLENLFFEKQILLDPTTCEIFKPVLSALHDTEKKLSGIYLLKNPDFKFADETPESLWEGSYENLSRILPPLKRQLDMRFREILSPDGEVIRESKPELAADSSSFFK